MNAIFGFMMNFSTDQRGLKSISGCQVTMKTTRNRVASVHELGEPLWLQKPGRYKQAAMQACCKNSQLLLPDLPRVSDSALSYK